MKPTSRKPNNEMDRLGNLQMNQSSTVKSKANAMKSMPRKSNEVGDI